MFRIIELTAKALWMTVKFILGGFLLLVALFYDIS